MNGPGVETTLQEAWSERETEAQELPLVMVDLAAARKKAWGAMENLEERSGLWWEQTEEGGLREASDASLADERLGANPALAGNRRERRLSVGRNVRIEILKSGKEIERCEAELRDVGTRGIGLVMMKSVEVGQQLCLRLNHERRRAALVYEVRHIRALADSRFAAGAELIGHIGSGIVSRPERLLVMLMMGRTPPSGRRAN